MKKTEDLNRYIKEEIRHSKINNKFIFYSYNFNKRLFIIVNNKFYYKEENGECFSLQNKQKLMLFDN